MNGASAWSAPAAQEGSSLARLRPALTTLLVGGVLAAASHQIEDAEGTARRLETSPFDEPSDFGNTYGQASVHAGGALALGAAGLLSGDPHMKSVSVRWAGSLLLAGGIVGGLKLAVDRPRPDGTPHSFPSGHTAAAFTTAAVLNSEYGPRAGIPAFALAGVTALGRMEDRKHFLSDVVFGAAVGLAAEQMTRREGPLGGLFRHAVISPRGVGLSTTF